MNCGMDGWMDGAYPLENLLSPDIVQSPVEILDLLHDILHLALVFRFDLACLTNGDIQREADRVRPVQPAPRRSAAVRRQTDLVLPRVGSREREPATMRVALGDDAVVVVEGLIDGNQHLDVGVDVKRVQLVVDNLRLVVAYLTPTGVTISKSPIIHVRASIGVNTYQPPGCPWEVPRRNTWSASHSCRNTGRSRAQTGTGWPGWPE